VARINIKSAPEPVLRALPGMTDAILTQILALRSQGRRITSVAQVMAGTPQGRQVTATVGRGGATNVQVQVTQTQTALTAATTVDTQNVELTFYVQGPASVQPTRMTALMTRTNNQATISWQLLW
jgi:hypothetical protein